MATTGSLIPAQIDMHAVSGATFGAVIALFTDVAQTTPFDLTGFTATLTIGNGLLVLTSGAGLDIAATFGTIGVNMSATTTATIPGPQHYSLQLIDAAGAVSYPLIGMLTVLTP